MRCPPELASDAPLLWSYGTGRQFWSVLQAIVGRDTPALRALLVEEPLLARAHFEYRTPLHFAVRENNVEAARLLLECGASPLGLVVDEPLYAKAVRQGWAEMAALLYEHLTQVLNAWPEGNAVCESLARRDWPVARERLERQPELLHRGDERGNQPIHFAVMSRQIEAIDYLLAAGAERNAARPDGARPMHLYNGDYHYRGWRDVPEDAPKPRAILDHLVAQGVTLDLNMACLLGDAARVREILHADPGALHRGNGYQSYYPGCGAPLKNACVRGDLELVRYLLDAGADPNLPEPEIAPQGHALMTAVSQGHHEIAALLLERGANPNARVESSADVLSAALRRQDSRLVELLCSYGARRDLEILAYYNDLETAAAVLHVQPALAQDPGALRCAAEEGHLGMIRLLLRYAPGLAGEVSLPGKTREITEYLFAHGMPATLPDWLGVTALHRLARQGDCENAELFLERGADPQAVDDELRMTPLGWAEHYRQAAIVDILKKYDQ